MMRTYTRKTPNFQQLDNVLELCRLCLEKPSEAIPIYKSDELFSSLALRIMVCVGLEVTKENGLPNHICMECHKELERFHAFRTKCESSYQKLKSHILAVKQRDIQQQIVLRKEFPEDSDWDEKQALVLTLNFDGTIHLKDGNDSSRANEEPLITLKRKTFNDEEKGPLVKKIETKQENLLEQQIENETNNIDNALTQAASNSEDSTCDQLNNENLATFLSSTLNALRVVTMNEDGTVTLLSDTLSNVEMETGDGKEIFMELVEEDFDEDGEKISMGSVSEIPQETTNAVGEILPDIEAENMPSSLNFFVWNNAEPANTSITVPKPTSPSAHEITDKTQLSNIGLNCKSEMESRKLINYRSKRVPCPVCGKTFSTRTVLQRHTLAVHAKERPHHCAQCGKRFAQKEVWARHLLVHKEKRPYQCSSCAKSFTQRGALAAHARLHAPPHARRLTLHQCPQCPKLFLHHSGLSRHLRLHMGKTWPCGACDRSFTDDSALRRHARTCSARAHAHRHTPRHQPLAERAHTTTDGRQTLR